MKLSRKYTNIPVNLVWLEKPSTSAQAGCGYLGIFDWPLWWGDLYLVRCNWGEGMCPVWLRAGWYWDDIPQHCTKLCKKRAVDAWQCCGAVVDLEQYPPGRAKHDWTGATIMGNNNTPETIDQKIKRYLPLLHHIGKNYRYKMQPDDYDDAVIEAMCAIQRGIETYDHAGKRQPLTPYVGTVQRIWLGYTKSLYKRTRRIRSRGVCVFWRIPGQGNLPESPWADLADEIDGYEIADDAEMDLLRQMIKRLAGSKNATAKLSKCTWTGYTIYEIGRGIRHKRTTGVSGVQPGGSQNQRLLG